MCERCDEIRGLRTKDRDLLELDTPSVVMLPHGVQVQVNRLRFKNAERKPRELGSNQVVRENHLYYDIGYFYAPYIPMTRDPKVDGHHG